MSMRLSGLLRSEKCAGDGAGNALGATETYEMWRGTETIRQIITLMK
jgi:hypothetical protein